MTEDRNTRFYEPILSAAGVLASLIAALSPLFSTSSYISSLFANPKLATPSSIVAFILSLGTIWIGSSFSPHINLLIRKDFVLHFFKTIRKQQTTLPTGYFNISNKTASIILILIDLYIYYSFIILSNTTDTYRAHQQSVLYISFFLITSYLFSNLVNYTKQMYEYKEKKRTFPKTIQNLMEENGLINQGIRITENIQLDKYALSKLGIETPSIFSARLVSVKIKSQEDEVKTLLVSDDGRELIKIL